MSERSSAVSAEPVVQDGQLMAVQVDDWVMAPDGQQYRVLFGRVRVIRAKDLLGLEPRNSANWFLRVGEGEGAVLVAGCRIHYAFCVTKKPQGTHVYDATVTL